MKRAPLRLARAGRAATLALLLVGSAQSSCGGGGGNATADPGEVRNVILFVGDGMGFAQVEAASRFADGTPDGLSFQALPHQGRVSTAAAGGAVTDSAAAATAMATGVRVGNGVLSLALPGDGRELETVLERLAAAGLATGLVTTTFLTHATPAAFVAHQPSRDEYAAIAADYLQGVRPQVLLGGAKHLRAEAAAAAGYTVVGNRAELLALDTEAAGFVFGGFGDDHLPYAADATGDLPSLAEATRSALAVLDNDPDGLFLLVEGGRIDHAGHANNLARAVAETLAFADAVSVAREWAAGHGDTLILVTADHETGGLRLTGGGGPGELPEAQWVTGGHTGADVPYYAWGRCSERVPAVIDNTDVYRILTDPCGWDAGPAGDRP